MGFGNNLGLGLEKQGLEINLMLLETEFLDTVN